MFKRLLASPFLHLIFIILLGIIAYSNTFHARFLWDERYFIEENPAMKDPSFFMNPSMAEGTEYYEAIKNRYIGYLTFALNYRMHGLEVTGYHIFNFTVHILNALLVYFFVRLTFMTPFFKGSGLTRSSRHIALLTGLVFVSHPIQTEAVTYIFQRLASLMTFFYLLSIVFYIKWRLAEKAQGDGFISFWRANFLYIMSLIAAVTAMKTKENAFTLPVVITLYEYLFFAGPVRKRLWHLLPMLSMLLVIPLSVHGADVVKVMASDYLLTEFRVIITYMRLLFMPLNQNIDYDYPIYHSFFDPEVFFSFLFSTVLMGFAAYLYCRSKKSPASRLVAFGIFWFFITLSVESTIVKLPMVIDEYRLYLPSLGVFMAVSSGAFMLFDRINGEKTRVAAAAAVILIPILLAGTTYARNSLWESEVTLWEDTAKKSPGKARVHFNLGFAYSARGMYDKAIEQYLMTLAIDPGYVIAHLNLGFAYYLEGRVEEAIIHFEKALYLTPDDPKLHLNLAIAYRAIGNNDKAQTHLDEAKSLNPEFFKFDTARPR